MDTFTLFFGLIFVSFFVQFFIGCRAKHKILRYIPLYFFAIALMFMIIALTSDKDFHTIAAMLWGIIGGCLLSGYGLALLLQKLSRNSVTESQVE